MAKDKTISIGDKVEYLVGDKWKKGVVHGIKKAEAVKGPDITLGYLIDTGKDERVDEFVTEKGKPNLKFRQPEQVEVLPENIRAVK